MGGGPRGTIVVDSDSMEGSDSAKSWSDPSVYEFGGELKPQKTIVTEQSCLIPTENSLTMEEITQFSEFDDDNESRIGTLEDEEKISTKFGFGGIDFVRVDEESQNSSASVDEQNKTCLGNDSESEDAILKELQRVWRLKCNSRKEHRRTEMYRKIIQKNSMWKLQSEKIKDERERVLRYTPGFWLVETGGMNKSDYQIPTITTLLLVGPRGAGKSTLINNIVRVLGSGNKRLLNAQVSHKSSAETGSYFLQEYTVPETSKAFCIFDSRGLSESVAKDFPVLKSWMFNGIRHGEMVVRSSDDNAMRMSMMLKARDGHYKLSKLRKVNYVIFVVSALSILEVMDEEDLRGSDTLVKLFNCPSISFKDDRPIVVMTHGDELNDTERIRARIFLGELLGISAVEQVYDISDDHDLLSDMALVDMLEHSLQLADKNLPYKESSIVRQFSSMMKVLKICTQWPLKTISSSVDVELFVVLGVSFIMVWILLWLLQHKKSKNMKHNEIEWHRIRHLWHG